MRYLFAVILFVSLPFSAQASDELPEIDDKWRLEPMGFQSNKIEPKRIEIDIAKRNFGIEAARIGQPNDLILDARPATKRKVIKFASILTDKSMAFGEIKILF